MAIPLKNGADLYNFEVLRMRFHNLGADPTSDFGVGQVYFNTSTSEGSGKRVRIYDGSAFRSLAYFDEIDNRLKLLEGEIDTDAIISNMKEVSAFLEGFKEDESLMDVLSGKLDKAGGEIKGSLNYKFVANGGDATGWTFEGASGREAGIGALASNNNLNYIYLGWGESPWLETNCVAISSTKFNYKGSPILHSGNVGEYKAGGLVSEYLSDLNAAGYNKVFSSGFQATNRPSENYATGLTIYNETLKYTYQLAFNSSGKLFARYNDTSAWSAWKTIAFTDSDITGNAATATLATKAVQLCTNPSGLTYAYANESSAHMTLGRNNYAAYLDGSSVTLRYGSSLKQGFTLNSSGNVTIGSSDLAGTDYKLFVHGEAKFISNANSLKLYTRISQSGIQVGRTTANYTGGYNGGLTYGEDDTILGYIAGVFNDKDDDSTHFFYGGPAGRAVLNIKNGNVGIGTISPSEALHVVGNLYVTGNIIADGEVSAGGAGEEGDAGTGTGGGDALIYSQEFTPTTTSITITHNLSATKGVIVQVWEKNGNYWDMVLVDVEEVDTNTVTLFFGKTETTVHKVVIMG